MSTYFNIVNLDKKEQASLVIVKSQSEVDQTISQWEQENSKKWSSTDRDPQGYEKQEDGSWTVEQIKYYLHQQKFVLGFIFFQACADQWGHVSPWFGDRVVIISDAPRSKEGNSPLRRGDWNKMNDKFKPVKFYVSYEEWMHAKS